MSEIVLTVPNNRAGAIALDTIRNRGEQRRDYLYLGDLSRFLPGSLLTEYLPQLPAGFHLIEVREEIGDALIRDFLGLHREPDATSGERGHILSAEPNWGFSLCAPPGGSPVLQPAHAMYMAQLQVQQAHAQGNQGACAHIALIDTGADGVAIDDYYDLLDPITYHPGKAAAADAVGHGTALATLIREVAPQCTLTVIRTTDSTTIPLWHLLAGIAMAVIDAQAEILNLSLGLANITGTCTRCGASPTARGFALEYLMKALRRMASHWFPGLQPPTYVAATGNDGSGQGFFLPARYDVSLAVGSVNQKGQRSSFSTYGSYQHSNYVMAPGGEKANGRTTEFPVSDNNDDYCGTSIAAAYASSVLALLRTDDSSADLLQLAAQKVSAASPASVCGSGRIEYS
ncbi:S8/S53 family peptidase [Paludibaculum fermentans]|uniref:S8/S53 family peptidase n=1 Tax=Paludibaculum fermentans TaxID=1473598 RepID=A0A7S7SI84_PALFE|nr:S8/S53 family peptidase [Paludibaculum fermentans]QOY86752.1 S8/S53 family peptidase [Paludibaculum fermentans]